MIYSDLEYERNLSFIDWIKSELLKFKIEIDVLRISEFYDFNRDYSDYIFLINRSRDYNVSLMFELNGFKVFNNSKITLLGNNKLAGYHFAMNQGFDTLDVLLKRRDEKSVLKSIYGYGGKDVSFLESRQKIQRDFFLQEFLKDLVGDIRFYIIGNRIHRAVIRKPGDDGFISNYSRGNDFELYSYSKAEEEKVLSFISSLDIDYAGVDFFLTSDKKLIFNEIEDVVGSRMLSELGINDNIEVFSSVVADRLNR